MNFELMAFILGIIIVVIDIISVTCAYLNYKSKSTEFNGYDAVMIISLVLQIIGLALFTVAMIQIMGK